MWQLANLLRHVNMPQSDAAMHKKNYVFLHGDNVDTIIGSDGNRIGNYGEYISRQKPRKPMNTHLSVNDRVGVGGLLA